MDERTWMGWVDVGDERYVLPLTFEYMVVEPDFNGGFRVASYTTNGRLIGIVQGRLPGAAAMAAAEDWVRAHRRECLYLVENDAAWRDKPATKEQRIYIENHGVEFDPDMNAGQACRAIARIIFAPRSRRLRA